MQAFCVRVIGVPVTSQQKFYNIITLQLSREWQHTRRHYIQADMRFLGSQRVEGGEWHPLVQEVVHEWEDTVNTKSVVEEKTIVCTGPYSAGGPLPPTPPPIKTTVNVFMVSCNLP